MSRNYLVIPLVAAALLVAPARPAAAIAHGDHVPAGKYRFATKLTMTGIPTTDGGTRDSWCSGALIAPRWVITAGHCFRDAAGKRVDRTVARTTASVGGHEVEVVDAFQAPDNDDVALAELDSPVTDITPIRLGDTPPKVGDKLRLTGYGLTTGDESAGSPGLRTGVFVVGQVRDSLLDVSGSRPRRDTSACLHDSGGPYFSEAKNGTATLRAVVSTGPGCPHPGADFAARTDLLGGWIAETTRPEPAGPLTPARLLTLLAVVTASVAAAALALRRRGRRAGARRR
ncbi:S1 family peptidase [Actinoplanes sp. CA-142083]|uniref:S1 family peptidase n=1 Tax=Actinoplanes sp. CA-142083 TaxID=3239903 RepID=UPI003D8BDFC9